MLSDMAQELAEEEDRQDDGIMVFEHIESFNLLCAGESGLGKSTFLRNSFAHLDPTKWHEMKRQVAEKNEELRSLEEKIHRNEQESRQCDDRRSWQLREDKRELKVSRDEAQSALNDLLCEMRQQELAVTELRAEISQLEAKIRVHRSARDEEENDELASRMGQEVITLNLELMRMQSQLAAELRRENLDIDGGRQTTTIEPRVIREMPLFHGSKQGLEVTLIDAPGYGDLLVDTLANSSADKICAEVERRLSLHLSLKDAREKAQLKGMSIDRVNKEWNELVQ